MHFGGLVEPNDLLVLVALQLLHEVCVFLHQPNIKLCLLVIFAVAGLLLLLEALLDPLPQGTHFVFLLGLELVEKVPNLVGAQVHPLLVLLPLDVLQLLLHAVGLDVVLLPGEALLDLPEVDGLAGLFLFVADGLLDFLLEFLHFGLVPHDGLLLQLFGLRLVLQHLLVPILIELGHLLHMGNFHLVLLALVLVQHFSLLLLIEFLPHLRQSLLGHVGLHVLALLLPLLLMAVEDLPA